MPGDPPNRSASAEAAANGSRVELGGPVTRQHASDQVFREIAAAILRKELAPEAALPPERELSERFGVSRIVVREAIHRLKEYGLVRVRQGSATIVLDPDRATDIRLLGLEIDLVTPDSQGMRDITERQTYAAAALLDLAEQRLSEEEIAELERLVAAFLAQPEPERDVLTFERAFWTAVARGTRNRIYLRETLWFLNLIERDEKFRTAARLGTATGRAQLYRSIVAAQRKRQGSADLYLRALRGAQPAGPAPALSGA